MSWLSDFTCEHCCYWRGVNEKLSPEAKGYGMCRRFPKHEATRKDHWCGEHKDCGYRGVETE